MKLTREQQQELDRKLYNQKRRALNIPSFAPIVILSVEEIKKKSSKSKKHKEMHVSVFK